MLRAFLILLSIAALACASTKPRVIPVVVETPVPPPQPKEDTAKKVSVGDLARNARDDVECEREVKRIHQVSTPENALAMLDACIRNDKFRNLRMMVAEPWRGLILRLAEGKAMELVAQVVATRGMQDEDFEMVRSAGISLFRMKDAFGNPSRMRNRYVLVRGIVTGQRRDERGRFLVELAETARRTADRAGSLPEYESTRRRGVGNVEVGPVISQRYVGSRYGKVGSYDASEETGRTVTATALDDKADVMTDSEYAVLGKFRGASDAPGAEGEAAVIDSSESGHGQVWLIRAYKVGVVLPEISR